MLVLLSCTVSIPEFFFVCVSRMNIDRCIYIYSIHSYTVIYIYIHIIVQHTIVICWSLMDIWVQCFFLGGVKLYVCLADKVDKVDISLHMYLQYDCFPHETTHVGTHPL